LKAVSADRTDRGREAREVSVLRYAGLRGHAIVMVEFAADGPGNQLAVDGLLVFELGRRVGPRISDLCGLNQFFFRSRQQHSARPDPAQVFFCRGSSRKWEASNSGRLTISDLGASLNDPCTH
jgi:hypothetical protein